MPKSPRNKSHRSDKHSSRVATKRSDSQNVGSRRDGMKRSDGASVGSGARVLRNTHGKKRKSSSPDVYPEKEKDVAENGDSSSGKKRKERGEDLAKPDTWNGSSNDDRAAKKGSKNGPVDPEKVKNSKALIVKLKSRYSRHESSTERHADGDAIRTESAKRRSEREHVLRDYRDHKERDKEHYSDREKVREHESVRDKNVQNSRRGRSDDAVSRSQHFRRGGVEVEPKAKKGMRKKKTRGQTMNEKMQLSQFFPTTHPPIISLPINTTHSISEPTIHPTPISQPIISMHSISQPSAHPPQVSQPIDTAHSLPNADISNSSQHVNKKRGRGPAQGIPTWGTGERFHVDFDRFGYPTGKCEQPFIGQLGVLARSGFKLPLTYLRWTDIPNDILDVIWREVQENTDVPLDYKSKCLNAIGLRWREWKYHVKRDNYDIYTTDEERLANVPDRVVADQWRTLVQYWGQDAVKDVSKQNSINREHLRGYHRMGRSSFRSIRLDMEKQGNDQIDGISVFIRTRTDKKGNIDCEAQKAIEDMNMLLEKVPEEERTSEYRDSCFTQVMGEDGHGQLRAWGLIRKKNHRLQPSHEVVESIRSQLREEMQSQFDSQITKMKTQMEAQLKVQIEEQMARLQQEMGAHLERIGHPLTPTTAISRSRVGHENSSYVVFAVGSTTGGEHPNDDPGKEGNFMKS